MSGRVHIAIFIVACLLGLMFASVSTFDFAQHLDRQVHDLHCSFVPGMATRADDGGAAGCQVTLMSPYSSVLRAKIWGGIPISLGAMGVFAFLAFRGVDLLGREGAARRKAAAVTFALSSIPVVASLVMGIIAMVELEAACKLCIGIYGASLVSFLAAGLAFMAIRRAPVEDGEDRTDPGPIGLVALAQLGGFVAIPVLAWWMAMPDYSKYVGTCGKLADTVDKGKVMVALDQNTAAEAIEVFDPLCPACRAFDRRLAAAGLDVKLHRKAVLFPLDTRCNWNVDTPLHPGACTVSEAILCAEAGKGNTTPGQVIQWAFEQQETIREGAKNDPPKIEDDRGKAPERTVAERMVDERFPDLAACVGSDEVRQRLNRSIRWGVAHSIPVVTPQLYIEGNKLCPEDTDLGLEYSLSGLLRKGGGG